MEGFEIDPNLVEAIVYDINKNFIVDPSANALLCSALAELIQKEVKEFDKKYPPSEIENVGSETSDSTRAADK